MDGNLTDVESLDERRRNAALQMAANINMGKTDADAHKVLDGLMAGMPE